jgi:hypothetical protein
MRNSPSDQSRSRTARRWCNAAAVTGTVAIALAGCATVAPVRSPLPAAESVPFVDCDADEAQVRPGRVSDGFVAVIAYRCDQILALATPGAEPSQSPPPPPYRYEGDLSALVAALAQPDDPKWDGPCPLLQKIAADIWLEDASGTIIRAAPHRRVRTTEGRGRIRGHRWVDPHHYLKRRSLGIQIPGTPGRLRSRGSVCSTVGPRASARQRALPRPLRLSSGSETLGSMRFAGMVPVMRLIAVTTVSLTVAVLAGCAGSAPSDTTTFSIAWENCTSAFEELSKTGVFDNTPCENWIESEGREEFADFWSDPEEFIAYVVREAQLGALEEHTR